MKRLLVLIIVSGVFLAGLGITSSWALVWEDQHQIAYRSDNLLRLHIMGNSNSIIDQYLKRQIKNIIIQESSSYFRDVPDLETAVQVSNTHLPALQKKIQEYINSQGRDLSVQIELGRFDFPTRTYNNITLPAGEYQALKVYLGEAKGNNWWCVLFPPLCIDHEEQVLESNSDNLFLLPFTPEKANFTVEYRLKIFDLLDEVPQWLTTDYWQFLRLAVLGSNGFIFKR